jgi:hypothetical protein
MWVSGLAAYDAQGASRGTTYPGAAFSIYPLSERARVS